MKHVILLLAFCVIIVGCQSKTPSLEKNFISYRQLHEQQHANSKSLTEKQWDSLHHRVPTPISFKKGKVHPTYKTFGWHPYTNGNSYTSYNFDMLWGISYFSYALNPADGNYKSIHEWKTTALVDSAKAHNCKVFLTVSNFGAADNQTFLTNTKAQENFIVKLKQLLALRNADGVNLDFEGVPTSVKTKFMQFIINTSKVLKKHNPSYQVSLCLYAEDWNKIFDIPKIDSHIDFYTLMGYDYYGSFSKFAGPVTPFKSSKEFGTGLETSVMYYLNKGVASNKLIVGLPYYGAEWYTNTEKIPSKASKFLSHPPYKTIKKLYIDSLEIPVQFNTESASSYIAVKEQHGYKEIWFENVHSLSLKYQWIKEKKLAGVGIWALGYDEGSSELWDLLTENFSK